MNELDANRLVNALDNYLQCKFRNEFTPYTEVRDYKAEDVLRLELIRVD